MITIISIVLTFLYLLSCFFTLKGVPILTHTYANPLPRHMGIKMLLIGLIIRFVTLLFAWLNGLPLFISCIAQFLPIVSLFIYLWIDDAIRKKKTTIY
ncbi:hypothetical protein [Bacillus cihuensis]|uniref:hypothetical protein n=1 Tax=Bacillus cihuensis TaxID=1208599 RepID=UPI00042824A7|nr:hypothetical protein [Bacillus cihuensis]